MAENRLYRFPYQGRSVEIPIVNNPLELRKGIRERVIPGLEQIATTPHSGLAFVKYMYKTDDLEFSSPAAFEALKQALGVPEQPPIHQDPIVPRRANMVAAMRKNPYAGYDLEKFNDATFFIGPMLCEPIDNFSDVFFSFTEDHRSSHFQPEHALGIHGEVFLADLPDVPIDRVNYKFIVDAIDNLFDPYKLG